MSGLNNVVRYFDLQSKRRGETRAVGEESQPQLSVIPQYIALVIGIAVQPYLAAYQASGSWTVSWGDALGRTIFAFIAGLVVFPGVYRKAFDANQPSFVQFCTIVSAGIGWKALLGAVKVPT